MKLKLIPKVLTPCSKPEKLHERVFHSFSIMFIHFYLVDVRHFENHIVVYILALFGAPLGLAL